MTTRRTVAAALGASALVAGVPSAAHAQQPSQKLVEQYQKAYKAAKKAGANPGRNIVTHDVRSKQGLREARRGEIERSLEILQRMVAPAPSAAAGSSTASPALEAIAACESGGDPTAVDASGTYRGKYQFDYGTWASVGGSGDPAAAPEAEQDMRAQMLYEQRGSAPWPNCA